MLHGSSGKALESGYSPTRAIIRASFENSVMGDFHKYKQIQKSHQNVTYNEDKNCTKDISEDLNKLENPCFWTGLPLLCITESSNQS